MSNYRRSLLKAHGQIGALLSVEPTDDLSKAAIKETFKLLLESIAEAMKTL